MKHYIDQVLTSVGQVVIGATVTVHVQNASPGTGALANIYSDDGVTLIGGSVVTTDSTGTFNFYAPDGRYDLVCVSAGTTKTVADVLIQDITEMNVGDATANLSVTQLEGKTWEAPGTIGSTTPNTGTFTTTNNAVVDAGVGTKTQVAIFERTGAAQSSTERAVGVVFKDGNNVAVVAGVAGIRNNSLSNFNGSLGFYASNTGAGSGATNLTALTEVGRLDNLGDLTLSVAGGAVKLNGSSSGTTTVQASATASGTLTLPAATDTLVGRATTDNLTNKDLLVANSGNNVNLLNQQGAVAAITGNGAAQVVYTFTIPANTVTTGKSMHLRTLLNHNAGAANVTYTVTLNGVTILTFANSTAGSQLADIDILCTGATTGQTMELFGPTSTPAGATLGGLAWTSSQVLQITFTVANTDQVAGQGWKLTVEQ